MKKKNPNAKKENFIVAVTSVVLAVLLLVIFGLSGIENFFSQPIVWKEADYITIKVEFLNYLVIFLKHFGFDLWYNES